jgi:hypothetical protein
MSWIFVPNCPPGTNPWTWEWGTPDRNVWPFAAGPKWGPKAQQAVWHERPKALPKAAQPKAQPKAPPAASARAGDGCISGGMGLRGRLHSNFDAVRYKEPHQHSMRFSYTVAEDNIPPLPDDDPECVYQIARIAIPKAEYKYYRNTLSWSPRACLSGGWFVAMPLAGECNKCGEAWSTHGSRCEPEWWGNEAR